MAERFGGEIVNADSMQVYDVLRILTNRPDDAALVRARHHLFGVLSPAQACSAAMWQAMAAGACKEIWRKGKLPIVVGGTALSGGVGGPHRTLLGALVIIVLSSGMDIMSIKPYVESIVYGLVVIAAVAVDLMLAQMGERGGFADAAGAAWTARGQIVARHDWGQASQRFTSCRMTGRHSDTPTADYTVRFPDGRSADLSNGLSTDYAVLSISYGLSALAPRAAGWSAATLCNGT